MRTSSSPNFDLREAVESLRDAFTPRSSSSRDTPRDIRAAILEALSHGSKNGQQVIQAISTNSGGDWMPSAGVVYPALQLLTDSGLLSTGYNGERIVYSLTDAGQEAAEVVTAASAASHGTRSGGSGTSSSTANQSNGSTSESSGKSRDQWRMPRMGERINDEWNERWNERSSAVPRAGAKLAQAAAQVTQSGTREQQERAAAILDETRKRLYAILAED
jgi:DNA-binding PadR family transcriptional regulator